MIFYFVREAQNPTCTLLFYFWVEKTFAQLVIYPNDDNYRAAIICFFSGAIVVTV